MLRVRFASDARLAFGLLLLSVLALGAFLFVGFGPLPSRALHSPAAELPAPPVTSATEFVDATEEVGLAGWRHELEHGVRSIADAVAPGLGLLDLDQDGDLDLVVLRGTRPERGLAILRNELVPTGKVRFVDATEACRVSWRGAAQGICAGDVDADGDLDLYLTARGPNLLLKNLLIEEGELAFEDATAEADVAGARWHWVSTDPSHQPSTLPGEPQPSLGPDFLDHEVPEFSTGAAFGDFEADGDLDLYVANYVSYFEARHALLSANEREREQRAEPPGFMPQIFEPQPDRLYVNEGDDQELIFRDVSRAAHVDDRGGRGMGVLFLKIDGDDYPEIYVANDASDNVCLHNVAIGADDPLRIRRRFEQMTDEFGLHDPNSGMGIARGDADGDADLDLVTTNWRTQSASLFLFRIDHRPQLDGTTVATPFFTESADAVGLGVPTAPFVGWGCAFLDFDNDGDEDLFLGNGFTSPRQPAAGCSPEKALLFQNVGSGRFVDVTATAGAALARNYAARGVVAGDVDQDGDLDLVIAQNHGPLVYLENRLKNGNHSLTIAVRIGALRPPEPVDGATAPPRQPVRGDGANVLVVVDVGGRKLVRELLAGDSYLSQSPYEAHFGLGARPRVDEIRVTWPTPRARKLPPLRNVGAGRLQIEAER